jgi:nitrogen fixation protein
LKRLDDELGPSLHKLEIKLKRQRLVNEKLLAQKSGFDIEFNEIIKQTVLPIMIEYKKFLESKQQNMYLSCIIERPYQLHEGITFELKDSIKISKQPTVRRITFFPRNERIHIFEEGLLGDGHPVELSYAKNEISKEFVRKKMSSLIKEYIDKLLLGFQ